MAIIKVKNLGKKYQLRHRQGGYLTLRDSLSQLFSRPLSLIRDLAQSREEFWALKDIDFQVEPGEVVGIIGHNGAGKSTLLKILSQITPPTTGEIRIGGRVGSLLEVGTGFHQELSGRENIFLNGAILGMKRQEINKKFASIVEFSGIEKFLDTPVKHYSSGMYVRLAFAVAAHMDPEILIVDEVLAVGDADFQKKCLGKMDEITRQEGRTILFVSHNLSAVRQLCGKGILLEKGRLAASGNMDEVISKYENSFRQAPANIWENQDQSEKTDVAHIVSISLSDSQGQAKNNFLNSEDILVKFTISAKEASSYLKFGFDLVKDDLIVFRSQQVDTPDGASAVPAGISNYICRIPKNLLNAGEYFLIPMMSLHYIKYLSNKGLPVIGFRIAIDGKNSAFHSTLDISNNPGAVFPLLDWRRQE